MACDPQALANASRCISQCIPEGQQIPALISLFCTIADNGGGGGGGSGTVTSFSAGNLSPLFTTSVATPTTTPALSFSLTAQANNTVFAGPNGGGPLAPTFRALVLADISGLGTGVATALAVNLGSAGALLTNNAQIFTTLNGAVSTPSITGTGTWFTGGTSTTTKPYALVQPTGTTSTNWNTGGTGIGVNAAAGFAGDLIALQTNAVAAFSVTSAGVCFSNSFIAVANGFQALAGSVTVDTGNVIVTAGVYTCQGAPGLTTSAVLGFFSQLDFTGGLLTNVVP